MPSEGFRGDFPAASLKRRRLALLRAVVSRFRGDFPAASLKPIRREGLCDRLVGFRGDFPAASLKHSDDPSRDNALGAIPRGLPRGLIEAGPSRNNCKRSPTRFRGDFPAASLKLSIRHRRHHRRSRFRGDFPAASLKHVAAELAELLTGVIPRGLPRGLIEASAPPPPKTSDTGDSAGTSPRPH